MKQQTYEITFTFKSSESMAHDLYADLRDTTEDKHYDSLKIDRVCNQLRLKGTKKRRSAN